MAGKVTAEEARAHIAALTDFRIVYEAYLRGRPRGGHELRRAVQRALPSAQEALDAVGGATTVMDPPAAGSRLQYRGLANLHFCTSDPASG